MSESLIDEFERRLAKCRDEAASGLGTEMSKWYSWLIDNGPKIVEMARSRSLRTENKALRAWLMQVGRHTDAEITDGLAREARPRAKTERPQ